MHINNLEEVCDVISITLSKKQIVYGFISTRGEFYAEIASLDREQQCENQKNWTTHSFASSCDPRGIICQFKDEVCVRIVYTIGRGLNRGVVVDYVRDDKLRSVSDSLSVPIACCGETMVVLTDGGDLTPSSLERYNIDRFYPSYSGKFISSVPAKMDYRVGFLKRLPFAITWKPSLGSIEISSIKENVTVSSIYSVYFSVLGSSNIDQKTGKKRWWKSLNCGNDHIAIKIESNMYSIIEF